MTAPLNMQDTGVNIAEEMAARDARWLLEWYYDQDALFPKRTGRHAMHLYRHFLYIHLDLTGQDVARLTYVGRPHIRSIQIAEDILAEDPAIRHYYSRMVDILKERYCLPEPESWRYRLKMIALTKYRWRNHKQHNEAA